MKNTVAAPILLVSASIMVCGLGIAQAQEQEQEQEQEGQTRVRPAVPAQTPRLPFRTQERLRPAIKQLQQNQERNQQQTPEKRGPRARGRGTNMDGAGGGDTGRAEDGAGTGTTNMGGTGALGGTGGAGGATGNIQEFETGIDYRPMSPGARVTFNLEDADLPDLVRLISSITGKRFILPGKVRSIKATVYAPTKVTAAEAYRAFLSILELNGMTVVPSGRYLKIVETSGIESQPIPLYNGGARTPTDDRFVTRMHRVSNVSAEDVATLLSRFKTREGQVTAYAPTNTVILTDMGSNIRRMLRVLEAIDVPRGGEQVWIEPIHYVNASEMATLLTEIFPVGETAGAAPASGGSARQRPTPPRRGQAQAAGAQTGAAAASGPTTVGSRQGAMRITKIIPDERSNSLIILATERAYLRILELIRQLDVPMEGEGGIHVHYVQHGDAEEIAGTLASLIGGGSGGGGGSSSSRAGARGGAAGAAGAAGAGGNSAGAVAAGGGGAVFEGDIRVTAHKPTNALVITSSLHDYAALRRVIERLDARRRQVFIDAVIMEMSVNRSNELGVSWHGGAADVPAEGSLLLGGSNAIGSLGFPDVTNPTTLTGAALGVRGPEIPESQRLIGISIPAFGVALTALSTSGDTDILSTPHILAMDNEEAEISVGQNVPLQTSGFSTAGGLGLAGLGAAGLASQGAAGALGALGGLGGGIGNVPRQDVGTTLRITPHINESDEIRLEIEEEISEAEASTEGSLGVRTINKRTAKTQMVVRDQQTVVIGGLMRDTTINEETKVPVLGDIPLLGVLFRQTRVRTEKRNLLLFLTPYIIRDASDLRAIYERKMRERQEFIDRFFVFGDQDYEPHVDYTRTRGLVMEIVNELDEIAYEIRLAEEALGAMPPEHIPRSAVGTAPEDLGPSPGDIIITPNGPEPAEPQGGNDLPGSVEEPPDDGGEG